MPTKIVNIGDANAYVSALAEAAQAIRAGGLVVFPTETVYGVGANAASPSAVARLRDLKGRGQAQPFTVHLGQRAAARKYLSSPSALVRRLVRRGWPGPLTLVCAEDHPERTEVARELPAEMLAEVYAGGHVGLRCPDHAAAARWLTEAGVPVVASSANRHGLPPPTDCAMAMRDLEGWVDYALDGGRTRYNASSTIVEVRGNAWRVLRAGALDERAVERLVTRAILFVCTGNTCRSPMAEALWRAALAARLGIPGDQLAAAGYRIASAGTFGGGGGPASGGALGEMARRGLDLSGHRSRALTPELVHQAERVFVMSAEHKMAVVNLLGGDRGKVDLLDPKGSVADPIGGSAEQYRRAADQIAAAVAARVEEFADEDRDW